MAGWALDLGTTNSGIARCETAPASVRDSISVSHAVLGPLLLRATSARAATAISSIRRGTMATEISPLDLLARGEITVLENDDTRFGVKLIEVLKPAKA